MKTSARGYGSPHQRKRRQVARVVERGEAFCVKPNCGGWIDPDEPWDLAHSPFDRSVYLGPMHARCNRDTRLERRLRSWRVPVREIPSEEWL